MGLDVERYRQRAKEIAKRRGKNRAPIFKTLDPGLYGAYICPPTDEMMGFAELIYGVHWGVAGNRKQFHVCFGDEVLRLPGFAAALDRRNEALAKRGREEWIVTLGDLALDEPCDTCGVTAGEIASDFDAETLDDMQPSEQCVFHCVPLWFDGGSGVQEPLPIAEQVIRPYPVNWTVRTGLTKVITRYGDITDPTNAQIVMIERENQGKGPPKYQVSVAPNEHGEVVRGPVSKHIRALLKQYGPGLRVDPLAMVVGLCRSRKVVRGWLGLGGGVSIQESSAGNTDIDVAKPACFATGECDAADAQCQACPVKIECAAEDGVEVPPDPGSVSQSQRTATPSQESDDDLFSAFDEELKKAQAAQQDGEA